jgi:hypothetical protein
VGRYAVGRLDGRAMAIKKIHFRSAVPPWAKNDALEMLHEAGGLYELSSVVDP